MTVNRKRLIADWHYPTRIHFGPGRVAELPRVCRSVGMQRPLMVTDAELAEIAFVGETVVQCERASLSMQVFSRIQSNPLDQNVEQGREVFRQGRHDGIIALGGGSAMDAGKAIALLSHQPAGLWEYSGRWHTISRNTIAPVVAVPTTSGTGSEVGRAAVITDTRTNVKSIILHPNLMPAAVVADPELTVGLSPRLTAATGMDALAHCLEAYCADFFHPMSDGIAMEGIRYVQRWLPVAVQDGSRMTARAHMMAAATLGAVAFQKGLGAIHALSHPLGAVYNTHHGLANAVLMPYVMEYNRPAIEEKLQRLSRVLGLEPYGFGAVLDWILELRAAVGIPHTLRETGIPDTDLASLARMASQDPCAEENPVPVEYETLLSLYRHAYRGG